MWAVQIQADSLHQAAYMIPSNAQLLIYRSVRPIHKPLFAIRETTSDCAHRAAKISLDNLCEIVSMLVDIVATVVIDALNMVSNDYRRTLLCQLLIQ